MPTTDVLHLLVPLSLSENTDLSLDWAVAIAGQLGARICLFHAAPEGADDPPLLEEALGALARDAQRRLGPERRVTARFEAHWDPSSAIARAASEGPYDMVLMLTHERTFFERLRQGSLTDEVVSQSRRPVLAIPDDLPAPSRRLGRHALVATALDAPGPLAWARRWAQNHGAGELTYLYVIDTPRAHLPEVSRAQDPVALFDAIIEHARMEVNTYLHTHPELQPPVPFEVEVRVGDSAQEISRDVRETDIDLVITGHHHRNLLGRILHGSVAEEVIHRADVPVLVVPTDLEPEVGS